MTSPACLCWVLVNTLPYHEARLRAAAMHMPLRVRAVQLVGRDAIWAPQASMQANENYDRRTLFPDKRWQDINGRAMVRGLRAVLDELKPNVVCINGWSFGGCIAALGWCVANRVPAVLMSESTAYDQQRRRWKEAIKRRIVALCSASLVGGTPHRDYIAELGASPGHVFMGYDAVDNDHFREGAERARRAESSCGRSCPCRRLTSWPALDLKPRRTCLACFGATPDTEKWRGVGLGRSLWSAMVNSRRSCSPFGIG